MKERGILTKATTALIEGAVFAAAFFRGWQLDIAMAVVFGIWFVRVAGVAIYTHRKEICLTLQAAKCFLCKQFTMPKVYSRAAQPTLCRGEVKALGPSSAMAEAKMVQDYTIISLGPVLVQARDVSVVCVDETTAVKADTDIGAAVQDVPSVWYELQGKTILETLVVELNLKHYNRLTIKESGEICVLSDGAESVLDRFMQFPGREHWAGLVEVIENAGLSATTVDDGIAVAW